MFDYAPHRPGHPLPTFGDNVGEAFLRQRLRDPNAVRAAENLDAVPERLGGLPPALEQGAARWSGFPVRRFGQLSGTRPVSCFPARPPVTRTRPLRRGTCRSTPAADAHPAVRLLRSWDFSPPTTCCADGRGTWPMPAYLAATVADVHVAMCRSLHDCYLIGTYLTTTPSPCTG